MTPQGTERMASQAEQNAVDGYAEQFIAADRNRRRMRHAGGGNIERHARRKPRQARNATCETLDQIWERKVGTARAFGRRTA